MNTLQTLKTTFFIASVAVLASIITPASGQMEYMAEATQPEYMTRDLVVFAEGLNLDDTQEVIVEAMFDSYEEDFENGWASTQERLNRIAQELRKNAPASSKETLEPVFNALGDWLKEKRILDEGLLANVQAILVPEQRQLWSGFVQRLYREKHIHRGRLSGESVDLFQIVRDSNLSPAAERVIQGLLAEYATAFDIALRTRDVILRGNPKKLFDNILSGNTNQTSSVDKLVRARIEVRDLNDRYIEFISGDLVGEDSTNFKDRALKRGYPRIYRRTPAQRIIRQAAENEKYSPEIIAQILQLEGAYLQDLSVINYKLLEMTKQYEPEVHKHRALAGQARRSGATTEKLEDPTREVFKEREAIGMRYIEMLRSLLSPDEFLKLDGAQRWVPRSELPPAPSRGDSANKAFGPGGLTLQGGNSSSKKKGSKDGSSKKGSKADPNGFGNSRDGGKPSKPGS